MEAMNSSTKKSVMFAESSEIILMTPQKEAKEVFEIRSAGGSTIADYER